MKHNYMRNLIGSILISLLILNKMIPVFAADNSGIDFTEKGSIAMTLEETNSHEPVPGGVFVLYYVAEITHFGEQMGFHYCDDFIDNGMLLDDLRAEGLADHLADYAAENEIAGTWKTADADGSVQWNDLKLGVYLIVQRGQTEGYYKIEPFLVTVPMSDQNGAWQYHVDASPKIEVIPETPSEKELSVKKVWVDNGSHTPSEIEVLLFRDHEVFDRVILNEENRWTNVWTGLSSAYQWTAKESRVPEGYTVSYNTDSTEIIITNTSTSETPPNPPLIQTGQLNWPIPVLAGLGILLFAMGWVMIFMKRKK